MSDELDAADSSSSESTFEPDAEATPEAEPAFDFSEETAHELVEEVEPESSHDSEPDTAFELVHPELTHESVEDSLSESDSNPDGSEEEDLEAAQEEPKSFEDPLQESVPAFAFTQEVTLEAVQEEPESATDLLNNILDSTEEVIPDLEPINEPIEEAILESIQPDTTEEPLLEPPEAELPQEHIPSSSDPEVAEQNTNGATTDRIASQLSETIAGILSDSLGDITKTLVDKLETSGSIMASSVAPETEAATLSEAVFSVPYTRSSNFVGRFASLSQLFGMWKPNDNGRIGLVGLGGIGKTELAIEFAYRVRELSPSTPIFWLRTEELELGEIPSSKTDTIALPLLVVDPGDKFEMLLSGKPNDRLIDKLKSFNGTVLLLARSAQHGRELVSARDLCEVGDLELEASVDLFRANLGIDAHLVSTEKQIQDVSKLVTCSPRAIIQVAKVINCTGMNLSQFLDLYERGDPFKLRLFSKIDPFSYPDFDNSVIGRGVFDVKMFRNTYRHFSRFLYQLFFLGGASVPKAIFSSYDPLDMVIILFLIKGHFLVVEDSSNNTYTIHPLVYLTIRNAIGLERSESEGVEILEERQWYEDVVLAFSKNYPDAKSDSRAWWKDCFAHLIGGYDLHNDALRVAVATIYQRESAFFKRKGMYTEALKMTVLARSVLPNPMPADQLSIIQDQVTLLSLLAKYRDMNHVLQSFSPDQGPRSAVWKKRMMAKLEQTDCANQYETAIDTFQQILLASQGSNVPKVDLYLAMDDVAQALMYKGKYRDAAIVCRKALAERKDNLGSSYPETLSSYHNLAEIMKRDGKFDEALRYIQGALLGRESLFGPDHPETVNSKVVKASILISKAVSTSDFDEAEAILLNCIDRLTARLSATHPVVISCKSEIALIMVGRGDYESAEQLNRTTMIIREEGPWLDPMTHPDTLTSKHQLAEVLRLKEGCKAADILSERVLGERTAVLTNGTMSGDDFHPDQLSSLHHRAIVLSGLGQHSEASDKIELALTGRKTILGDEHPDVFLSMTWKGEIMRAQLPKRDPERSEHLDAIESMHKQALERLTWVFGPEHQSTLQCATNLALLKHERGGSARAEAEHLHRQIYKAYQRSVGGLHPETLKSKARLAKAMSASPVADPEEAKKLWRESCAGFGKAYGVDAYVTAKAYKEYEKSLRTHLDQ
ncbi:hypothetical protein EG329_005802 [Mollisiaceae sp. DMI_Dod_QoI]|nr:hypothetical protein EG329_005802 [Helotiales sp. DMI_Dod_QoI]